MKVRSSVRPQEVTVTANSVLVASNITPYEEEIYDRTSTGYEYDCTEYSKDEYLVLQTEKVAALEQELQAAKILLGVN